tara:strand:- start:183 stop:635 length:453 start_codon:yes stop_codon:yes gene_type:complete
MDLEQKVEYILIGLIMIVLGVMFFNKEDTIVTERVYIGEEEFAQYPLVAWQDIHEKWDGKQGDIVKVKYRVTSKNTKLWMFDVSTEKLVHVQSYHRDPWKDKHRDFTYVWKLYKTERSSYISPGTYEIVVGGMYKPNSTADKLTTIIIID